MGKINREDMLELTRRMTLKRNCFDRIAGAYLDEEGFVDGTFNKHFLKLSQKAQEANLAIAKAIPFSNTNVQLKEYVFGEADRKPGSIRQLLMALNECGLKNDAMLDTFYEEFGRRYRTGKSYAIYFFHGSYDVPLKANDKESLWESEEVYRFLVCAVCPVSGDYEPDEPECGFLFPAFRDRSSDTERINVFAADGNFGKPGFTEETDMWICPKCGREFKRTNQGHYCGKAPGTVLEYIDSQPIEARPRLTEMMVLLQNSVPCVKEESLHRS